MQKNYEQKFISYALNLAKQNLGLTAPNPVVGCVITLDGKIIATGVTAKNGRPHAETIAIEKVANKKILEGAEIYITLEPCSHTGQTTPCVDEIIKYKFKKVVIATQDPDSRVDGKGIKKLRQANIDVVLGVMEKEAQEINRGFFKARKSGLPFVTLKLATSLDGKIATKDWDSKWITSDKARQFGHYLRATNDAILVGANTVRQDNPSLDCRIAGLEKYSPRKVIVSNGLAFDLGLNIFQGGSTIILTNSAKQILKQVQDDSGERCAHTLRHPELVSGSIHTGNLNIQTILCTEKNGQVDLLDALKKLCASGINSVLIEGGQNIATQFLKENLVDELVWIRSKKIIGEDGISAIGKMGFSKIAEIFNNLKRVETKELAEDLIEIYRR